MSFIKNIKFLLELIRYTSLGFSVCKIYQILELKKQKIQNEVIEFGSNNYEESLIKFNKEKSQKIYFSNFFKNKNKNYISLDLEKKNKVKKKFKSAIAYNVLEHIYDDTNAIGEFKKILKKKGKLYISTPFLYRYHDAPKDYKRYTLEYFVKTLKKQNFKIIKKLSLGTGPFLASYSLIFDYLKKIPLISYPVIILCYTLDIFLMLFHKNRINKFYPICIIIIAEK